MSYLWIRGLLFVLGALLGYVLGDVLGTSLWAAAWGAGSGVLVVGLVIFVESAFSRLSASSIVGGGLGLLLGLVIANLLILSVGTWPGFEGTADLAVRLFVNGLFGYFGLALGMKKGGEMFFSQGESSSAKPDEENCKVLDTSVIIDGRIADICETGFLEGVLIIPQFILKELQHIADSSDSLRRNRGRRGLDILQKIQKNPDLNVRIIQQDFPKIREVDGKLVTLGKALNAKILTNDYNLNKVAELQGVGVLNINQLANAVKPVVLPGEMLSVFVLKEGKEYGQGVAYLEDGTMVVVDNAKKDIGREVTVTVTSVLQTTAGRMIFTRLKEDLERAAAS